MITVIIVLDTSNKKWKLPDTVYMRLKGNKQVIQDIRIQAIIKPWINILKPCPFVAGLF